MSQAEGELRSVATDSSGNAYATGWFRGSGNFDPGAGSEWIDSLGYVDMFLLRVDATGALDWLAQFQGDEAPGGGHVGDAVRGRSLVVDSSSNLFVAGSFEGTLDFDPEPDQVLNVRNDGSSKIYLASFDASGYTRWALMVNDDGYTLTDSLAAQGEDVFILGSVQGLTDFRPGPGSTTLAGHAQSLFVTKFTIPPDPALSPPTTNVPAVEVEPS